MRDHLAHGRFFLENRMSSRLLGWSRRLISTAVVTATALGAHPALALEKAKAFPGLNGMDLAKEVTTTESYSWTQWSWRMHLWLGLARCHGALGCHW